MIAALQARGVDVVVPTAPAPARPTSVRGRRLGREDHIVTWTKPQQVPDWMSRAEYDAMPAQLTIRELRVRVQDKTKRVRNLVIVTTLLDAKTYQAKELGGLFRQRWYAELDLAVEDGHADGAAFDQEPGDGTQGGGDPPAGVQLDPGDHGRGGAGCGSEAAAAQLQGVIAHSPARLRKSICTTRRGS